jgi:hypothetical protein
VYNYITRKIKKRIATLLDLYEHSKGKPSTTVTIQSDDRAASYTATTSAGYQIKIVCKEITYTVNYPRRWSWFNRRHRVFEVYCECCPGTPDEVREVLTAKRTFPIIPSSMTSLRYKKKVAIMAYLDLLDHENIFHGDHHADTV